MTRFPPGPLKAESWLKRIVKAAKRPAPDPVPTSLTSLKRAESVAPLEHLAHERFAQRSDGQSQGADRQSQAWKLPLC